MNTLTKVEKASKKLTLVKELDELILKYEKIIQSILNKNLEIKIGLFIFDPVEEAKKEDKRKTEELTKDPMEQMYSSFLWRSLVIEKEEKPNSPELQMFLKDKEAIFMIDFYIKSLNLEREKLLLEIENIINS